MKVITVTIESVSMLKNGFGLRRGKVKEIAWTLDTKEGIALLKDRLNKLIVSKQAR